MSTLNRIRVLNTLAKHETLTLTDMSKMENLGIVPDMRHLQLLLDKLEQGSYVQKLNAALQCTYTITDIGIAEANRLKAV